jgi:hypothetical protein
MPENEPHPGTGEETVPGFETFGTVEPDDRALKEQTAYARGDEQRHEEKKQTAHSISIFVLRLFALTLSLVFLIRIHHLVAPRQWRWLDDEQLQTIDYLLFSGVIGGVIGGHLNKIFGFED